MDIPFVHLGARSEVSLGESIARVEELCWEAARDEQGYLGLTDVNSVGRAPAFSAAAHRAGLRPVIGAEIDVLPFGDLQFRGTTWRVRLLVEDPVGWRTLLRLVNDARAHESPRHPPHTTLARLLEDPRGLLIFLGGPRGELTSLLQAGRYERVEEIVGHFADCGALERCFFELPPIGPDGNAELARQMHAAALHFKLLPVVVPRVACGHANDDPLFRLMHPPAGEGGAPPRRMSELLRPVAERHHLQSRRLVAERYAAFPDALEVTLEVARHCARFEIPQPDRRFPIHDFARGVDAESYIWNTSFARATDRYGELSARYKERLDREFREIVGAGLANAVVTLARLVEEFEASGVQRGPGGGLFTNSLVASLLGLTRLDPLRFDLNFAIPPGLTAGSFPMLELSIPGNQEGEAVDALGRLFEGQVVPIGEWRTWTFKQALEQVALRMGRDGRWAGQIARQPSFQTARQHCANQPITWAPAGDLPVESVDALAWLATRLEGRARVLAPRPGQYTFSVEPMDGAVPQRRVAAEGTDVTLPVAEWSSEELGVLRHGRITFTHPRLLDLVGEATAIARQQGAIDYTPEHTPPDDVATYQLLRDGRTQGICPLESPLVRRRLRQGQPGELNTLIRVLIEGGDQDGAAPDFPTILLCHLAAATKAHHPVAFFAAALNQANGDVRRTAMLMEEIRDREIRVEPLDVNYCSWRWTAERQTLRPGMMVVRGMTAEAAHEILLKRRELHFADLAELCQRTDKKRLKDRQLESLLQAGALDSLGRSRAAMGRYLQEHFPLLRPAGRATIEDDEFSFFGRDAAWWVRQYGNPPEEDQTPQDAAEALCRENEALHYPLREQVPPGIDRFLHAARVRSTTKLTAKDRGQPVTLLGIVGPTATDPRQPNVTLVDIGGCLVRAVGALGQRLAAPELAGHAVLVTGILERESLQWRLDLESIHDLPEALHQGDTAHTMVLDLSRVAPPNQKDLLAWLRRFPGCTPIRMEWLPEDAPRAVRQVARLRVLNCPLLLHGLNRYAGAQAWSIEYGEGPPVVPRTIDLLAERARTSFDSIRRLIAL